MKKRIKEKVTKNTTLSEILKCAGAKKILMKHNLPCLTCPMAGMEMHLLKIGDVCETYGIDLKELLKELNGIYKKGIS